MPVPVKLDEDLPNDIAELFHAAGHDAATAYSQGYSGFPDDERWARIQHEQRMLATADKGFANALKYPPGSHYGVVLFRLARESRAGYLRLAQYLLAELKLEGVKGAIVVVSPDAIRVSHP